MPGVLEDDVLDGDELVAAALARLEDQRLGAERVEVRVAHEVALDVVLAHPAHAGVLGAALDRAIARGHRHVQVVERRRREADRVEVPALVAVARRGDRPAEHREDR